MRARRRYRLHPQRQLRGISGVGLDNSGIATLTDCSVTGDSAGGAGGLANYGNGSLTLADCSVTGNSSSIDGGLLNDGGGSLTAHRLLRHRQQPRSNAALANIFGVATLSGTTIGDNRGSTIIQNDGGLTFSGCDISGDSGAGYFSYILYSLAMSPSPAAPSGTTTPSGLWNVGGTMTLTDTLVTGTRQAASRTATRCS